MAYVFMYLAALAAGLILTPLVARLAQALNLFDQPGLRKIHASATPRLGGLAIVLSSAAALAAGMLTGNPVAMPFLTASPRMIVLGTAAAGVFLMGLADDIWGLRAWVKFLVQSLAALVVCAAGLRLTHLHVPGLVELPLGFWAWPLTCFWIVSISNALNLIDGLDGLAGGISLLACTTMGLLAWHLQLQISMTGLVVLMGSLCGFLVFNMHPARVFLGDCGALLLGFLLAESSMEASVHGGFLLGMGSLALVMGVPILDVCSSVARRLLQRRSISSPDRQHVHHRLLEMGLSHPQAVWVIHLATAGLALLALSMVAAGAWSRVGILLCGTGLLLVGFRRACMGSIIEATRSLSRNWRLWQTRRSLRRIFEAGQLQLRLADGFEDWWQGLCQTAEKMGISRIGMTVESRTGQHRSLLWVHDRYQAGPDPVHLAVPVAHRRSGPTLWMRAEIPTAKGLEAAGRVAARFTRLLEENSIAQIPAGPCQARYDGPDAKAA